MGQMREVRVGLTSSTELTQTGRQNDHNQEQEYLQRQTPIEDKAFHCREKKYALEDPFLSSACPIFLGYLSTPLQWF